MRLPREEKYHRERETARETGGGIQKHEPRTGDRYPVAVDAGVARRIAVIFAPLRLPVSRLEL